MIEAAGDGAASPRPRCTLLAGEAPRTAPRQRPRRPLATTGDPHRDAAPEDRDDPLPLPQGRETGRAPHHGKAPIPLNVERPQPMATKKIAKSPGAGADGASDGGPLPDQAVRDLAQVFKLTSDETR